MAGKVNSVTDVFRPRVASTGLVRSRSSATAWLTGAGATAKSTWTRAIRTRAKTKPNAKTYLAILRALVWRATTETGANTWPTPASKIRVATTPNVDQSEARIMNVSARQDGTGKSVRLRLMSVQMIPVATMGHVWIWSEILNASARQDGLEKTADLVRINIEKI